MDPFPYNKTAKARCARPRATIGIERRWWRWWRCMHNTEDASHSALL